MAKEKAVTTSDVPADVLATLSAEQEATMMRALLAKYRGSDTLRNVEAELQAQNAQEVASIDAQIADFKAQIDKINAELKPLYVRRAALTGKKAATAAPQGPRATCLECGQGRHSQWKNKDKGELNTLTANCKTYAAKVAAAQQSN